MNLNENVKSCSCACAQELRALGTVVEQLKIEFEARMQQQEQALGRALASLVPAVEALSAKVDRKKPADIATAFVPDAGAKLLSSASSAPAAAPTVTTTHSTSSVPGLSAPADSSTDSFVDEPPALHSAASANDVGLVRTLLAQGADPTMRDPHGNSAIYCAAAAGHVAALDALLKAAEATTPVGVSREEWVACAVNARGPKFRSPLHAAAGAGHTDAACSLLEAGANLDAVDAKGNTPLHRAVSEGHRDTVALLLAEGATADAVNKDGFTPLALAALSGGGSLVWLLFEKGANLQGRDRDGSTALHLAATAGHRETAQHLLEMGLDVNITTNGGLTALHAAAQKGYVELIDLLLEKGAKINAVTAPKGGKTPLLLAALGGHTEAVVMLLAKGASIDSTVSVKRIDLEMMLMVAAAKGGSSTAVKVLAKKGACVNSQVLEDALKHASNADVVWALADVTPDLILQVAEECLPWLAEEGKAGILQAVLGLGVDVLSNNCVRALEIASRNGKTDCVSALLQAGVGDNDLALHESVIRGHVKVVSAFLKHGMTDKQKKDALRIARKNYPSNMEVMKILVNAGANPFEVNSDEAWEFVKFVTMQKMKKELTGVKPTSHM